MKITYSSIWMIFEFYRWVAERKAAVRHCLREFEYFEGQGLIERLCLIERRQWIRESLSRDLVRFNAREVVS